jgi:hypothetical protein
MILSINKAALEDLYLKQHKSLNEIAKLHRVSRETIRRWLLKRKVRIRTKSEAMIKYPKQPFSGRLGEKSYMLGLRTGDVFAYKHFNHVRVTTCTTHPAFLEMMRKTFGQYSHVGAHKRFNRDHYEWVVYADLDRSFDFIILKPKRIPLQIIRNTRLFFHFLAGYADCEGSFTVAKSNENDVRFMFRIGSYDKYVLNSLKVGLERLGMCPLLYLDRQSGYRTTFGKTNKEFYVIKIYKKAAIMKLLKILLPLSRHEEKIAKIKFILKNNDKKWHEIEESLFKLRDDIRASVIK